MIITIYGFLWIIISLFGFFSKNKYYMLFILMLSAILQCNTILYIGDTGVNPLLFSSIIFIVYYFIKIPKGKDIKLERNKVSFWLIALFFILVISVLKSPLASFNISIILYLLQIFIYIITFIFVGKYSKYYEIDTKKIIVPIIWFVVIFGFFQMLMVIGLIPKFSIIKILFFNEYNNNSIAFLVSNRVRFYSTFMEPSYCAAFLTSSFMFLLFDDTKKKMKDIVLLILLIISMLLTFSTTAYIGLLVCLVFYLLKRKNYKMLIFTAPIILILLFVLNYTGVLDQVVFNKMSSGSALTRNAWNRQALANYELSPIIGMGYKTSRASSLLFTILAETGILGITCYLITLLKLIKNSIKLKENRNVLYALLIVVLCQFMAIPDLNFCVFWLLMYLYATFYYEKKDVKINDI